MLADGYDPPQAACLADCWHEERERRRPAVGELQTISHLRLTGSTAVPSPQGAVGEAGGAWGGPGGGEVGQVSEAQDVYCEWVSQPG